MGAHVDCDNLRKPKVPYSAIGPCADWRLELFCARLLVDASDRWQQQQRSACPASLGAPSYGQT